MAHQDPARRLHPSTTSKQPAPAATRPPASPATSPAAPSPLTFHFQFPANGRITALTIRH
jgi:hypothetical protein